MALMHSQQRFSIRMISILLLIHLSFVRSSFWPATNEKMTDGSEMYNYGVDVSYPIHRFLPKNTYWGQAYDKKMAGCYSQFGKNLCEANELSRIQMNYEQPCTQHNYTDIGFKKIKAPEKLYKIILEFYNRNKGKDTEEKWPAGSIYVNHWDSKTTMINFENTQFRNGYDVKKQIWDEAQPILEEWTQKKLTPTSLYGVRVYHDGAILATHVDRLPLVSSAIIQVDQDIDEPWPLEVYARDGKAYNVTMEPGDMVLYESHTTLHGRPFPMKGRFYANVFVHFAPFDHDEENENDPKLIELRSKEAQLFQSDIVRDATRKLKKTLEAVKPNVAHRTGGHEHDNHPEDAVHRHLEDLVRKEKELKELHEKNPLAYQKVMEEENANDSKEIPKGRTDLHFAAALGLLENVHKILGGKRTDIIHARDENGWQAIHEAARGGYTDIVKYLVELGADVTAQTISAQTPLSLAKATLGDDHEVVKYLESLGAPDGADMGDDAEQEETEFIGEEEDPYEEREEQEGEEGEEQ